MLLLSQHNIDEDSKRKIVKISGFRFHRQHPNDSDAAENEARIFATLLTAEVLSHFLCLFVFVCLFWGLFCWFFNDSAANVQSYIYFLQL